MKIVCICLLLGLLSIVEVYFAFFRYWHRSLNPKKLIDVKFSHLGRNMTMKRNLRLYKLPEKPQLPGFRKFVSADIEQTYQLVNQVSTTSLSRRLLVNAEDSDLLLN